MHWYWWLLAVAVVLILLWLLMVWARPQSEAAIEADEMDGADDGDGWGGVELDEESSYDEPSLWSAVTDAPAPQTPAPVDDDSDLWGRTT